MERHVRWIWRVRIRDKFGVGLHNGEGGVWVKWRWEIGGGRRGSEFCHIPLAGVGATVVATP
jgi:hypothetical protein